MDNVTLTLEERRVTCHYCVAGQLQQNEAYKRTMYNLEHPAFPHANGIHYQMRRFIFNAMTLLFSLIYTLTFGSKCQGSQLILLRET